MDYSEAVSKFEEFFSSKYESELSEAVTQGKDSIMIDYEDLDPFSFELTDLVTEDPEKAFQAAKEAISEQTPTDEEIDIKIVNFPEEERILPKDLRSDDINQLVVLEGLIVDAGDPSHEVVSAIFECTQCGDRYEKEKKPSGLKSPYKCVCGSRQFELVDEKFSDVQEFVLQGGSKKIDGKIEGNVYDTAEEIIDREASVIGIYRFEDGESYIEVKNLQFEVESDPDMDALEELAGAVHETSDIDSFLDSLHREELEDVIADIFERAGWRTDLTSNSNDYGIDIIARKRFPYRRKVLIQAKCNSEKNRVGPDSVRNYNSLKDQEDNVDQVLLITTSSFTQQAQEIGESLDLRLIGRKRLKKMISDLQAYEDEGVIEVTISENGDGDFDTDRIENGISEEQRSRISNVKEIVSDLEQEVNVKGEKYSDISAISEVIDTAEEEGISRDKASEVIEKLKREGELFEPVEGHISRI